MQTTRFLYTSLIVFGSLLSSTRLNAQSTASINKMQEQTTKNETNMEHKVNIGRISVPKSAIEEFKKQASITPTFLKKLPGYVSGEYFEKLDDAGNLQVVSVVTWLNEASYKNAQMELKKYYESIHFDRPEFVKRLNLTVEYGAYGVSGFMN